MNHALKFLLLTYRFKIKSMQLMFNSNYIFDSANSVTLFFPAIFIKLLKYYDARSSKATFTAS